MFEQMLLPTGGTHQRRNAVLVFAAQLGIVGIATAMMVYFDVMPLPFPQVAVPLVLSAPPPPPPPSRAVRANRAPVQTELQTTTKTFVPREFKAPVAPVSAPQSAAIVADAPPALGGIAAGAIAGGLQGGLSNGSLNGVGNGAGGGFAAPPAAVATPAAVALGPAQIRVGGEVEAARLKHEVMPTYPPIARATRLEGTVRLSASIAPDGTVENLQVLSGSPLLTEAAQKAVKQWTYQPTYLNGKPVEVLTEIDVNFTLG